MRKITMVLIMFSTLSFSQNQKKDIDSLSTLVENTSVDSLKIKYLLKLENAYRFTDYSKGLDYTKKALGIAERIQWEKGIALCYNNMGGSYLDRGEHSNALANYNESLKHSEPNSRVRLISYMNISNVYLREEDYVLSKRYIDNAFEIAKKMNDTENIAYCQYQMGLISRNQKKLVEATDYFKKSLIFFRANNRQFQIAEITNFLGEVTDDYKLKLDYLQDSKSIWDRLAPEYVSAINNSLMLAKTYIDIYDSDSLKKQSEVTRSKNDLLNDANNLANSALKFSIASDIKQYEMDAYDVLSKIYALKKEFPSAYNYVIKSKSLNDSIFSQDNKNLIAKLESQKEIELRDREIEINKIALDAKKKQQWFYIGGIGLLTVIGVLLFFQSSNRRKTNKKLSQLNTELDQANKNKTRFFSILNHDLRSPVANLIHFLHLQKNNPELMDAETKNRLENKTIAGAENLLSSMEDILLWSKGQMDSFKPKPTTVSVNDVFQDTKKIFSGYVNISFEYENPQNLEILTDKDYLNTIIRNLTSNAINVFTNIQNPTIIWKAWKDEDGSKMSIIDNGPGTTAEKFNAFYDETQVVGIRSGLGLHLVRDLASAIECEIEVNSEIGKGTTITLSLK